MHPYYNRKRHTKTTTILTPRRAVRRRHFTSFTRFTRCRGAAKRSTSSRWTAMTFSKVSSSSFPGFIFAHAKLQSFANSKQLSGAPQARHARHTRGERHSPQAHTSLRPQDDATPAPEPSIPAAGETGCGSVTQVRGCGLLLLPRALTSPKWWLHVLP